MNHTERSRGSYRGRLAVLLAVAFAVGHQVWAQQEAGDAADSSTAGTAGAADGQADGAARADGAGAPAEAPGDAAAGAADGAIAGAVDDDIVEDIERTPERCVSVNRLRHTRVISDRTVVFEMSGDQYRSNTMDRKCPGLERTGRFAYEVRSGRLCHGDLITVLEDWVAGLGPGFTCRLGEFLPITELEAQALISGPEALEGDIEIREVEPPPGGAAPPADDAAAPPDDAAAPTDDPAPSPP